MSRLDRSAKNCLLHLIIMRLSCSVSICIPPVYVGVEDILRDRESKQNVKEKEEATDRGTKEIFIDCFSFVKMRKILINCISFFFLPYLVYLFIYSILKNLFSKSSTLLRPTSFLSIICLVCVYVCLVF